MKNNDLMIGDWVRMKENHDVAFQMEDVSGSDMFRRWTSDGEYMIPFFYYEIEPIPITPEILEKNFRVVERSSDGYNLVINSELILAFHLKATLDFWIAQPRDCPNLTYSLPLPRYVHELQHCLKLCGIDKEIVI